MKTTLNPLHRISTLVLVLGAVPAVAAAEANEPPAVHEYLNGGYFSTSVTVRNKQVDPGVAGAPAALAVPSAKTGRELPYDGTRYRNGGYSGPNSSDESGESDRAMERAMEPTTP
jgi:hypothetical protein